MTSRRARLVRFGLVAIAAIALLVAIEGPPGTAKEAATATTSPASRAARAPVAVTPAVMDRDRAIGRLPVEPYGSNPDEFVRQRHDYPPDTPARLGPKVGRVLFDLETVVDEVSRAQEPGSRVVEVRGEPVENDELERARQALQAFFDDATPVVDRALTGEISTDQAFDELLARREELNCELMVSLGMFEEELYFLWPQTRGILSPTCANPRPHERLEVPDGHHLRGGQGADKHAVDG